MSTGRAAAIKLKPARGCNACSRTTCWRRINTGRLRSAPKPRFCREQWRRLRWFPRRRSWAGASYEGAAFFEDTIKVTPRLELRAGFRSESTERMERSAGPRVELQHRQRRSANHAHRGQFGALRPIAPNSCPSRAWALHGTCWATARPPCAAALAFTHSLLDTLDYRTRPDRALQHRRVHQDHRGFEPELHARHAAAVSGQNFAQQRAARYLPTPTVLTWSLRIEQQIAPQPHSLLATLASTAITRSFRKT